jgi:hypothetical protein
MNQDLTEKFGKAEKRVSETRFKLNYTRYSLEGQGILKKISLESARFLSALWVRLGGLCVKLWLNAEAAEFTLRPRRAVTSTSNNF